MRFTDKDLAKLHDESLCIPIGTGMFQLKVGKFKALLIRLEAAEDYATLMRENHNAGWCQQAYKAWQKAAGR